MENAPLYLSTHSPWESFPVAMVISGGGFNRNTVGSVKRRFNQLIKVNSEMDAMLDKFLGGSHPPRILQGRVTRRNPKFEHPTTRESSNG